MEKQLNVPILRFPEFKGEWENKKLGEVAVRVTTKNNSNDVKNVYTNSAVQGIVNQRDFFDKDIANQNNLLNYYVVEKDDFIYNPRISNYAPVGPISRNHIGQGVMSPLYSVFKFKTGDLDFIETYFSTTLWYEYIESIANYGARFDRMNITVKNFYEMPLPFPSIPEQSRIASFFSAIDEKLKLETQRITALKQYKKGVMQKLFSQELRFKEENGKEFPDWEVKKLGEVCDIVMGQSPSSTSYNSDEFGIPLIQGNADIQNRLSKPRNWTTEKTKECKIGDLILTVRAPVGSVAKSIHNACIGRGVCAIRNNSKSLNEFIYQFLLDFETKWISLEQGSTFTAVSGIEIKKIKILLPSLPEQIKIANFLSSIDYKIDQAENRLQRIQMYKKGLLQQMFC